MQNDSLQPDGPSTTTENYARSPNSGTSPRLKDWQEVTTISQPSSSNYAPSFTTQKHSPGSNGMLTNSVADFFSPEIFQIVLHNPTTSHQLLKFSQSRFCGENMEFLDKVDRYNTLLDELTKVMSEIYRSFTSTEAPRQLNLSQGIMKTMNMDIKETTLTTLPAMELIFSDAQQCIENVLATDIYPRFVKHQMTVSAERALASGRTKFAGLGDCFCLTSPSKADNPIVYASDGFVKVTGYSRSDIIPRNCRFLQGKYTDQSSARRIKEAVNANVESVELLLNYKKNGEPFWNLLYVAPLFNAEGKVAFFLGGQINCSTTIHNRSDILRALSLSDDAVDPAIEFSSGASINQIEKKRGFFRSLRIRSSSNKASDDREAGIEGELMQKIEKVDFKQQMKMFYTAYSKYLVLGYDSMSIEFYSSDVVEMLLIDPKNDTTFVGNSIFKVLAQYSPNMPRDFKNRVKLALKGGRAISADISLATRRSVVSKGSEKFATHWTPLKDEHANVRCVVVLFAAVNQDW